MSIIKNAQNALDEERKLESDKKQQYLSALKDRYPALFETLDEDGFEYSITTMFSVYLLPFATHFSIIRYSIKDKLAIFLGRDGKDLSEDAVLQIITDEYYEFLKKSKK